MRKGQRSKGKRGGWFGYLLSFLLGSLAGVGGYLYLIQEKSPAPEAPSPRVFLVDQIIHSQLYELGISKKDVVVRYSPEQSLIKVQLPRSLSFSLIEENLRRTLSNLGKSFSVKSSVISGSLQLEVRVLDRVTHQLTFIPPKPSALKAGLRPKIAIVIDDLGIENHISQELLDWNLPITFSILPFTPHSRSLAVAAHQRGKEVILHLPMEPYGYPRTKPGEGVLLQEMDEGKLLRQLSKDLEAIPYVAGVSNHMGSRFMEDPEKLRIIFSELKKRGLFFLDSRTTPQTVGLETAQSVGLRAIERSLFLDHSPDPEEIKLMLERLIRLSLATGKAIGIGHPHPSTLKALKEMMPKIKEKGIDIVPLSSVMD